ncbi:Fibrinogen-like protein A [Holothuria leucospilota]|uniref:Fibrinogen-like protein A n=1 Tax=Holothuria leucospilota TaxID=206669 RepID=A0A9Q1HJS0_HOLLE|nr:Fibrinogen-like protein A [Holothuria leucospilota]
MILVVYISGQFGEEFCSPIQQSGYPRDCSIIQSTCAGENLVNGEYTIQPDNFPYPFPVYCDFQTDGGNWTVFQRRLDGSVNFHRNWRDYKNGFGFLRTEFWLGNEKLAYMTAQADYELRIDLKNRNYDPYYAVYSNFRIGEERMHYKLILGIHFIGNASNPLTTHNKYFFTTYDADHDIHDTVNCANKEGGGWWFIRCDVCNLNGDYDDVLDTGGIDWDGLQGGRLQLKGSEMKIRPTLLN